MFLLKMSFSSPKRAKPTLQFIIVVSANISSIAHHLQSFLSRKYPTRIIYQLTTLDINNTNPNDIYIILYNSRPDKKLPPAITSIIKSNMWGAKDLHRINYYNT